MSDMSDEDVDYIFIFSSDRMLYTAEDTHPSRVIVSSRDEENEAEI
jgi:hypothetical protein